MADRPDSADLERVEDALVDGDVALDRGTARAALRHRNFRIVFAGTFASNVGTWMQNVLLGAWSYEITKSSQFVGALYFAQLGPLLFLSAVGGLLADVVDRRRFLVTLQFAQLTFSLALAGIALSAEPSRGAIVACVVAIGISNALAAPGLSAILPTLVDREDLPGAIALQSVQMNLSRVVGPALGALLYSNVGASSVFAFNALTYLFAIGGLVAATYPRHAGAVVAERGLRRLASGFRIARADRLIRRVLLTLASFSFFSLSFIGMMPVIAETNFGIGPKSVQYGLLYAAFGLGAASGAVSVGTFFAQRAKSALVRPAFGAFAALLATFALLRNGAVAFPLVIAIGYVYFVAITALSTVLQQHLTDDVRGRVMALWIMGFGGVVPVGVAVAGQVVEFTSVTAVILAGAAWAFLLSLASSPESLVRHPAAEGAAPA